MSKAICFFRSSIGLKFIMAVSGLLMSLFLLAHVLGNLVILVSPEAYNAYSHALTSNKPLLYGAEVGLIVIVIAHFFSAVILTRRNRAARVIGYKVKQNSGRSRRTWLSSYMIVSGLFLLFFIVIHLLDFKFGEEFSVVQDGVQMRDIARLVLAELSEAGEAIFYVVAMLILGAHLIHGVRSAFSSIGVDAPRYTCAIKLISYGYLVLVVGGFLLIPIWIFLGGVS